MAMEHENRTTVIGKFGDVCQVSLVDWRHKCPDEIIMNTPMMLVDMTWKDLPYQAIIDESTSINFREPFEMEGGAQDACDPSTANNTTKMCDFVLPNLEIISIGTQSRHYEIWWDKFCENFPQFRGFSPFRERGSRIVFDAGSNSPATRTFAGEVAAELSQATWEHIYRTWWLGQRANVDQFDGFFEIFDNGISTQGTCDDYPLVPTCIDMALYILGAAAAAAGGTVGPGDIVLPVLDPDRPGDAPADNIFVIYPGTLFETSIDLTGMDSVDVMTAWLELVLNEWGIDVIQWMLGVGKNQTKCLSEVAACKQACRGGDCRQLLVSDKRDDGRADRQRRFVRERVIEMFPYDDITIPMLQSPALRQRNKVIFMPWKFNTAEGPAHSLLWVWLDRRAARNDLFRDVPAWRDAILPGGFKWNDLHSGDEFVKVGRAFQARVWDWLWDQVKNCFQWWQNSKTMLLPQAPHLWLCLDGLDCSTTIKLPCLNPGVQEAILTCVKIVDNLEYRITFDNTDEDFNCVVGKKIWIISDNGNTQLEGTITTVTTTSPTADINVTLLAVGPFVDCVWDGVDLASGGKVLYRECL